MERIRAMSPDLYDDVKYEKKKKKYKKKGGFFFFINVVY